jgi:tRNA nucleotidyltransferase/poly(A) polymerase
MDVVKHSLGYLESRTEFWQQQKPIYARRKEYTNIQAKTQNAKVRRVAQHKTMEKIAHENGLDNPTQKQVTNVDFEQKAIKAAIKGIYKSLERKDYSATLESAQNLLLRLGEVENQAQRFQAMAECYSVLGITHLEIGGFAQAVLYHKKGIF